MGLSRFCFLASDEVLAGRAASLAASLGLTPEAVSERKALLPGRHEPPEALAPVLWLDADGLALQAIAKPLPAPVRVDFVSDAMRWRTAGGGGGEAVVRACGVKPGQGVRVLDATAGLGRDSWLLAHVGADVTCCERSPLIQALLRDGLARANAHPSAAATAARIRLHAGSSLALLQEMACWPAAERPETVYLDPMFPHRDKSALVKLDMRLFRDVVGEDQDADALLAAARAVATRRVVVKRPRHAPDLAQVAPHQRMTGQSNRFDLYAPT